MLRPFKRIYNRYFSTEKAFARRLRLMLGFTPAHISLFKLAFFHKSSFNNGDYAVSSNERLEFLGDAVLSAIVGEYLFKKYPNSDEGFMTKMRSKIVKRNSLDDIAYQMGLDMILQEYNNTRLSKSMLGNALEALVGAVYIEVGYDRTRDFVVRRILRKYLNIRDLEHYDDNYKSQLLEWCQKNNLSIEYKVISKYKADKRDRFKVAVFIDGEKRGAADDFNKKSAEQMASERALQSLGLIAPNLENRVP
ncbi:MAG: ribonuclease III [Saprospiraceae bacterium]